jgi:DNA-binding CsgD family transcriptional regulator/PAS domain-containing protein
LERTDGDIDESQFSELCGSLYEAAQTPKLMISALDGVRQAFGFEAFHQFVIDTNTGLPLQEWANQRITQDDMAQYAQHYFAKDPRPELAAKAGVGQLFNTRDVIDKRLESQSEIMQDFLLPRGVGHCIGGQLLASESQIGYVAFLDANDRVKGKSPKQLDFMRRLMPHLSKSTQFLLDLSQLRNRLAASEQALDASEAAIFTLTRRHRVVSANRKAESLLRQRTVLKAPGGTLSVSEPSLVNKWSALLQRVVASGLSESLTLVGRQNTGYLQASVSRTFSGSNDALTQMADLLVMVSSIEHRRVASVKQLAELFGLSQAEGLLARALAQGIEPSAFAESRGIKLSTVRTQIKSVMEKLQVKRMPDLVRVVLTVPAVR